ncbi:rhodanese-like domain-containing protein [Sulfurovum sp.]|uniref:rhodanese-like domain-containing protein n=1 Tax=Sulfurovum sp. TaxID=1969726 RepID=UPI002867F1B6|nr:rhodanese-like domain-containing protein [Sulfurovum sp.]
MPVKFYMSFLLMISFAFAQSNGFEYAGVPIKILDSKGKIKEIMLKRHIPDICKKVPINNEMVWTGDYAHEKVPKECKSTYVHTTGKLLPMKIDEDIDTYGELEVLAFIKHMQTDDSMLLIDGRKQRWFDYRTIPGSINIPFHHLKERDAFEFEFEHALTILGVKIIEDDDENESFDFSQAKTIAIFCNGPWCSQSVAMITALMKIGYPEDKMKWYRGGMQTWLSAGMTSTRK